MGVRGWLAQAFVGRCRMNRPNTVLYAVLAAAGAVAVTLAVLAAEHHGKRREQRAWLMEGAS